MGGMFQMMKHFYCLSILLLPFLIGCQTRLSNPGAYNDPILYHADNAIVTGTKILQVLVTYEYENRLVLASNPAIRKATDEVRLHAKDWVKTALVLRDAYAANPTPDNRKALDSALRVIDVAVAEALSYLTKYGVKPQ